MSTSFYSGKISIFRNQDTETIIGIMAENNHFALEETQKVAWKNEINLLKGKIPADFDEGRILFEYTIPRLGKRIDVVLLIKGIVFILEFKVNAEVFESSDKKQTMNYAIDLSCFHKESRDRILVPILVSTGVKETNVPKLSKTNNIYDILLSNGTDIGNIINKVLNNEPTKNDSDWINRWEDSRYLPTPTIVQAATALYNQNNVSDIANCESKENLSTTSNKILEIVDNVKEKSKKAIIFVTGVPGAGKTLVGLNIANTLHSSGDHAVYLSGNKPLVDVLTEALARDTTKRKKNNTNRAYTKDEAKTEVISFIQLVHHYRDATLKKLKKEDGHYRLEINVDHVENDNHSGFAEIEGVAIFDEAQRAWTREDLGNFLKDRNFPLSESEFFLWSMNLRKDFAVVVCLVGNGQEINHGEGGIKEWIKPLIFNPDFKDWEIYVSNDFIESEIKDDEELYNSLINRDRFYGENDLHLKTSIRSLRSERISELIKLILEGNCHEANSLYKSIKERYPIKITRDVSKAKDWLRQQGSVEKTKIWLNSKHYQGSLKSWIIKKCPQLVKSFFEKEMPSSNRLKEWINENFSNDGDNLINAAQDRGGTMRERVLNACTQDIYDKYFENKCPDCNIFEWIENNDNIPVDEKKLLLDEIPDSLRYGLLASSGAKRLKALGYEVKNEKEVSVESWFLDPSDDVRSSNFLEEVVSEFVVQGLELDFAGIIWDADFRRTDNGWSYYDFRGGRWNKVSGEERMAYKLNAYRVLLTRARLGMIIVVPEGDMVHIDGSIDKTRDPEFYNCTFNYLKEIGFDEI